ncbi:hypothetical protein N8987_01810 [Crocinitomix sp.]|nr:hypothetical protein [Crocinitomix sp.]
MERRFPPGYYSISYSNSFYEHNGNNYEVESYSNDAQIISSNKNEIKIRPYKYIFNWAGDTSFAKTSTLYVSDNKYVLGNLGSVNLYDGVISEKSQKNYIITGKFEFHFFMDFGPYSDWIHHKGDFKIEHK